MKKTIIGGEFPFHETLFEEPFKQSVLDMALQHHPDFHHSLTGGGYFSLKVILQHLKEEGFTDKPVFIPSFLCPSILKPFEEIGVSFEFYPVDEKLNPDLAFLKSKAHSGGMKVMMAIAFFGFDFNAEERQLLNNFRLSGIKIIEDRAQCLFPGFEPVGNYLFYSFRKFLPVDGSLLLSDCPLTFQPTHDNHHYTALKKYGQELRHRFLNGEADNEGEFLKVLEQAEAAYYTPGIAGFEMTNLAIFPRIDVSGEIQHRREVFKFLDQQLGAVGLLHGHDTTLSSPLCYPIIVPERDLLLRKLSDAGIFAPVHWRLSVDDIPETFVAAHSLSKSMISLPIRINIPEEAWQKMVNVVRDHLESN